MKNDEPIDQSLFEPDEREHKEPTRRQKIQRYIRVIVGVVVILGLLYLSGVYQLFLYQKTPSSARQQQVESLLDAEILILPLQVFIFVNKESLGSQRSEEGVKRLVENTSAIWDRASIELKIEKIIFLEKTDEEIRSFFSSPTSFVTNIPDYNYEKVNVFLPKSLRGLNGISFGGLRSVAVADFTTVYDFRVLAHEIGHVLGLGHVPTNKNRLMFKGANGFDLTLEEIIQAREAGEKIKID